MEKTQLCDGIRNCRNGEDEEGCDNNNNYCDLNNGGCDQICVEAQNGATCKCQQGYKLSGISSCIGNFHFTITKYIPFFAQILMSVSLQVPVLSCVQILKETIPVLVPKVTFRVNLTLILARLPKERCS